MRLSLVIAIAVIGLDQASKVALIDLMAARGFVALDLLPVFSLVMVWNSGVSFGLFAGNPEETRWILAGINTAVAVGLLAWAARQPARMVRSALGLVAGGALGNAIDRVVHGAVADFFDFHIGDWAWPAFNVADIAISCGVMLLLFDSLSGGAKAAK